MQIALIAALVIGAPLPSLEVTSLAGEPTAVAAKHGRPLVIDLFATWCGPCRESLPVLERLRQRFGDRVDFVSISEDDDGKKVAAFVADLKLGSRVVLDARRRAYERLGAHRLPTTYIVDGNGVVYKINHGYGGGYEERMTTWLQALLSRP